MTPLRLGWVDATTGDIDALAAAMDAGLASDAPLTIGFLNPHVYVTGDAEPAVRDHLAACDLVCVDGVGVALAHRLAGGGGVPRTVAEHLFRAFWTRCTRRVDAVAIGIEPDAIARAAAALNAVSAGARIVATLDGYATGEAIRAFLLQNADARLILIGAGSPRSEAIATLARRTCPRATIFHCGAGTLKTWAGSKRRAPARMSAAGLEWLHRLAFEPHVRARYLVGGPRFLVALLRARRSAFDRRNART